MFEENRSSNTEKPSPSESRKRHSSPIVIENSADVIILQTPPGKKPLSLPEPLSFLQGNLPHSNSPLFFREEKVLGDGNCGFTTLAAERNDLVDVMLKLKDDLSTRMFLGEEIEAAFELESIPKTAQWNVLLNERMQAQNNLDQTFREIRNTLDSGGMKEEALLPLDGLLQWLSAHEADEQYGMLTASKLKVKHTEDAVNDYYQSPEAYEYYVNHYRSNLWLGYKSALVFAKTRHITLYVWHKCAANNQLVLINSHVAPQRRNLIHMLCTGRFTHYNLLVEVDPAQVLSPQAHLIPLPSAANRKRDSSAVALPQEPKRQRDDIHSLIDLFKEQGYMFFLANGEFGSVPDVGKVYALAPEKAQRFAVLHMDEDSPAELKGLILGSAKGDFYCQKKTDNHAYFFVRKDVLSKDEIIEKLNSYYKEWMECFEKFNANKQRQEVEFVILFSFSQQITETAILKKIGKYLKGKAFPRFVFTYPTKTGLVLSEIYNTQDAREAFSPSKIKYHFVERAAAKPVASFNQRLEFTECNNIFINILSGQAAFIENNPLFNLCKQKDNVIDVQNKYYLPHELNALKDFFNAQIELLNRLTLRISNNKPKSEIKSSLAEEFNGLANRVRATQAEISFLQDKIRRLEKLYLGDEKLQAESRHWYTMCKDNILKIFKEKLYTVVNMLPAEEALNAWFNAHEFTVLSCLGQRLRVSMKGVLAKLPEEAAKLLVFYWVAEHPNVELKGEVSANMMIPTAIKAIANKKDNQFDIAFVNTLARGFADLTERRKENFDDLFKAMNPQSQLTLAH
jgi:hypothetical protein